MKAAAPEMCVRPSDDVLATLDDDECKALDTTYNLFAGYVMYLDDKTPVALPGVREYLQPELSPLTVTAFEIRLYGGLVSPVLDE